MIRCRECGEEIMFIPTPKGKYMPCDPGIIPYWQDPNGNETIINGEGIVVRCVLSGDPEKITDTGHIPHWATCRGKGLRNKR